MDNKKVWFVTGASKGLGLTLVKKLLADGYKVAATSRKIDALITAIGEKSNSFLPLEMNLVDDKSVANTIAKAVNHFGKIDVVVNNAGYGQMGTIEELSDEEVRKNYDVNVFGVFNVIRNMMPYFRTQKSGHFFNISSIAGYSGSWPGWSAYSSTKFAVSAITEGLAAEAKEFGIKTTLVYPGAFRTNFLESDSMSQPLKPIEEYVTVRQSQIFLEDEMKGKQQGDPKKAAEVLINISKEENPALHFFMGEDSYNMAYAKIETVKKDLAHWKKESLSTGFTH